MSGVKRVLPVLLAVLLIGLAPAAAQKKKPPKDKDQDAEYQYQLGAVALRYGLMDEAIRYGNLAAALDPRHYGAQSLLGSAYFKKGLFVESTAAYEKAAELKPETSEVHTNLGLVYSETGALDKAVTEFEKAIAIDGNADAAFYLAKAYYQQKKLTEALDAIQKCLIKNGKNPGAYNLKGVVLNALGRFAQAAGSFQAGLVLAPGDVNLQVNLGIAYINTREPEMARATFEKVIPHITDPALKLQVEQYLKTIKDGDKR